MDQIESAASVNSLERQESGPLFHSDYLCQQEQIAARLKEREKWDAYYAALPMQDMPVAIREFGRELATRIEEILPKGGNVLEAGCGAGWQSMALAENRKFNVSLLDFSPEALNYAKHSFSQHNLPGKFICQDVFLPGEPDYDLVFNAGVLEHYNFEQQVEFLRGMASRSRGYVLVLVPNRLCYWYWIWRIQASTSGHWPFGKEVPMTNLADAFQAAGINFLGQWFGAENWTEQFVHELSGLDQSLREHILAIHRSPLIPNPQKSYLVAVLGSIGEVSQVPTCWRQSADAGDYNIDQLTAALGDSLATLNAIQSRREHDEILYRYASEHDRKCDDHYRQIEIHHQNSEKQHQQAENHYRHAEIHHQNHEKQRQQIENHHQQTVNHQNQIEQHFLQAEKHYHQTARYIKRSKNRREKIQNQLQRMNLQLEQFQVIQHDIKKHIQQELQEWENRRQVRIASKDRAFAELIQQLTHSTNENADLQSQLANMRNELAAKHSLLQQWDSMMCSRGWKFLQLLYRIRKVLIPRGSRRGHIAYLVYRMMRFPIKSLLAVANAITPCAFRQLPPIAPDRNELAPETMIAVPHCDMTSAMERPTTAFEVKGLVSVILPVYNHVHLLSQAIESVLAQTYRHFELIVVDDGSTDGVEEVLAKYAAHPQVRILVQQNQKLPNALSNGFQFARGEFWTWTSADNLMQPEQLGRQVEFLQAHTHIAMVYSDYLAIDDHGEPLKDPSFRPHNRCQPESAEIHLPCSTEPLGVVQDNFIGPCFMYRGWVGRLLGEYDDNLGVEDYDYWMRLNSAFPISHLGTEEILYQYRVHDDSLSGRAAELKILERAQKLMTYHRERVEYYNKPWTIYVDEPIWNRLKQINATPHQIIKWLGESVSLPDGEKALFLVQACNLPKVAEQPTIFQMSVAAWFDDDTYAPHKIRHAIQRTDAACFATNEHALNCLALSTSRVFFAESVTSFLKLAVHDANNRSFRAATHPTREHARKSPCVFLSDNQRLRILLQVDSFTQGGMEQVVIDLATSLDRRRFLPVLLVLGEQCSAVSQARDKGVRVLTLPKDRREKTYRRLMVDEEINLINAHYSLFGADIAAEKGIPFVQTIHNTYVWLTPEQRADYQANDKFTSAYVCVSHSAAHYSDVKLELPVEKMLVVPNGIDTMRLEAASNLAQPDRLRRDLGLHPQDFIFLNVATIQPPKAQAILVQAFARVITKYPNARLIILGRSVDPKYLSELKQLITNLHLDDTVLLAGHHNEIIPFYLAADAFVLPSLWEGWSLALTEAVFFNLPVIATSVGGAADLLTEVGGILIPPPFNSITELDILTVWHYLTKDNQQFIDNLANAMISLCDQHLIPVLPGNLRDKLNCRTAYQAYEQLFLWLVQGGHPSAVRSWCTSPRETAATNLIPVRKCAA